MQNVSADDYLRQPSQPISIQASNVTFAIPENEMDFNLKTPMGETLTNINNKININNKMNPFRSSQNVLNHAYEIEDFDDAYDAQNKTMTRYEVLGEEHPDHEDELLIKEKYDH